MNGYQAYALAAARLANAQAAAAAETARVLK